MPGRPGPLPRNVLAWSVMAWSVLARQMLSGRVLAGHVLAERMRLGPVLAGKVPGRHRLSGRPAGWLQPSAHALAEPQRAGPKHAAQLAGARHVRPVPRPQREVLMVAGQVAGTRAAARGREPVVRVRPGLSLLRIEAGGTNPGRQLGELITAALAYGRERHRVPGQVERDLIRLASLVPARHSMHRQHGTIDAT
jgi:hypothetical protein